MNGKATPLRDLAKIIRSKNAGPFRLTFDILFDDVPSYERVRDSGVLDRRTIARIFHVPESQISSIHSVDMARALKFTLFRSVDQGAVGDTDSYGCQQHAPLLDILIP